LRVTLPATTRSILLNGLALCLGAAPLADAGAAPPPPVIAPEAIGRPVEGYDLGTVYQKWRYWVESHKGAAADELLKQPEKIAGAEAFGEPLLRFAKHNDFGHFLSGEIRLYCLTGTRGDAARRACHYRLRRAYVPHDAAPSDGKDNPVARWTRETFDAAKLARHLRASGLAPETDWWMTESAKLF
jgi:hypothetical protein